MSNESPTKQFQNRSKSPYILELNAPTQQKSQQSFKSHYTSKFDKSMEMDLRQSMTNEFEIKKLMNLVELQQHEINNWKRRYEQAEARCQSSNQTKTLIEYERHLDQLTQDLKQAIQSNDDLTDRLRERDDFILKLQRQEDSLFNELDVGKEELNTMRLNKESQINALQQAHFEQLAMMDEQVQNLQDELIKRNQNIEYLKQEIEQQYQISGRQQDKEIEIQGQLKEEIKLIQLEQRDIKDENKALHQHNEQLIIELQELKNLYERSQEQSEIRQREMKSFFTGQLEELEIEVSKLNENLQSQQFQIEEYTKINTSLEETIQTLNIKIQDYEQEINELNEEIENLNQQGEQLTDILHSKGDDLDEMHQQKSLLALKNNENNLLIQRLQVELEGQKSRVNELQRQQEISEQMKEEIKRSQIDIIKRQMECKLEEIESDNRQLRYQYEMKCRECEEWKQQLKRQ